MALLCVRRMCVRACMCAMTEYLSESQELEGILIIYSVHLYIALDLL